MSTSDRNPGDGLKDTEPTELNPHSPQAIEASYERFKSHITDLCKELESFSKECRHLRWSYALIRSSHELRQELESFLSNVYENARQLSPSIQDSDMRSRISRTEKDGLQSPPLWFEQLAEAFEDFRENLNEFCEYTNDLMKIDTLLNAMVVNLNYRAACLARHNNNFDRNMRYYVHELAMEQDLVSLTMSLRLFTTYDVVSAEGQINGGESTGMSGLQYEQRSDIEGVLSVSAVATFFSAVTATMLQISLSFPSSVTVSIVNTFWFCFLVFRIGSALNSILVIAWKRSIFGSHRRRILPWITVWIRASVPIVSIACFSAGLGLFTFASHQASYTSALTLAATAIASLGLFSLLLILYEFWFALLILRKAPEKRGSGMKPNIPPTTVSPTLEKTNSLSSGYSDLSLSSSTTVISRPARLIRAFNNFFRGGSPAPPLVSDQERVNDAPALESLEITPQATDESARQRWTQAAKIT